MHYIRLLHFLVASQYSSCRGHNHLNFLHISHGLATCHNNLWHLPMERPNKPALALGKMESHTDFPKLTLKQTTFIIWS